MPEEKSVTVSFTLPERLVLLLRERALRVAHEHGSEINASDVLVTILNDALHSDHPPSPSPQREDTRY